MPEHQKDFDEWNERKKAVNNIKKTPYFEEREIWWCALGVNIGFEQDGTSRLYRRPVLIIKKWSPDTCLILPVTSSSKQHYYRISIGLVGERDSYVLISQMKTIDARRLGEKVVTLSQEHFDHIGKTIKENL
jgi:mRNA interferase MazF